MNGERRTGNDGREPIFLLPASITVLVAAFLAITAARGFLSAGVDGRLVYTFAFVPDRYAADGAGLLYPGGAGALAWSFLTYAFLHEGWSHVLINSAMFAALARPALDRLGATRLFAFLAFVTIGGALGHLAVAWGSQAPMLGASGAVSGLLGAVLRFVFRPPWAATATVAESLAEPRVRGAMAALVLMNLVLVWFGSGLVGGDGGEIAWGAHLGGFLAGFLAFGLFDPRRANR
ncbi:MAG: rhomboid family intramembrane serine protease [Hyphomicrobiales bacterium]|nr:rhomboid family intramembrane serine protease [Hyphomicrobiales bacterium]